MGPFRSVTFEKAEGIAWIALDRPQLLNAVDTRMRDELWLVFQALRDDPDIGVAIFKGLGERAFSAGADVSEFGTAPSYIAARRARQERDLWGLLLDLDRPLIAAIHGYALGAGLELSMACDFRIAAEDAVLGLPEVKLAYIPSAGGTQLLPRTIKPGPALELILSGEMIGAGEAYRLGLVHRVVPREELYREAETSARHLLGLPARALRYAKQAVARGLEMPLAEGLALLLQEHS